MTVYPTEEQLVLVMLDRVSEAQRIATKEAKESINTTGTKRKRKDGDEQEIDTDHALFVKKKKVYKGKNKKSK